MAQRQLVMLSLFTYSIISSDSVFQARSELQAHTKLPHGASHGHHLYHHWHLRQPLSILPAQLLVLLLAKGEQPKFGTLWQWQLQSLAIRQVSSRVELHACTWQR